MHLIKDLNIEKEIFPLFNAAYNKFTEENILNFLQSPLHNIEEIKERQAIIKAMANHHKILKDYAYTVLYFHEVYHFFNTYKFDNIHKNTLAFNLLTHTHEKNELNNKLTLSVNLFYKLYQQYYSKLDFSSFPDHINKKLEYLNHTFTQLQVGKYEQKIAEGTWNNKDLINFIKLIEEAKIEWSQFWSYLIEIETYISISNQIIKHQFIIPSINENGLLTIKEFYHPSIKDVVKNNYQKEDNVVIINGPNMSGKSSLLKSISLCIYLAHLGIAIPATTANIPLFDKFIIYINKEDNIEEGYSHFYNEILILKDVLQAARDNKKVLAVFDEVFSATNIEDASSITESTLLGLKQFNHSLFLISTHIQSLKDFVLDNKIQHYYLSSEIVDKTPHFSYQLKEGWSDLKIGKLLFELEGLNKLLKSKTP